MAKATAAAHPVYSADCRDCPRLAAFLDGVRASHPDYHALPVAPFGDAAARLLIVGLAPGMHGANRSGRPFTGDFAGILLYRTLHRFGFSTAAESVSVDDRLQLLDCRITNAVKCLPPQNKPTPEEIRTCRHFLEGQIADLPNARVFVALGQIAHQSAVKVLGGRLPKARFGHLAEHVVPDGRVLIDSYHCSRYNQNTGRLTEAMFDAVFARAVQVASAL